MLPSKSTEIIPASHKETFFSQLRSHCFQVCMSLLKERKVSTVEGSIITLVCFMQLYSILFVRYGHIVWKEDLLHNVIYSFSGKIQLAAFLAEFRAVATFWCFYSAGIFRQISL